MIRPEFRKHLKETLRTAIDFAKAQGHTVARGGAYNWPTPSTYGVCLLGSVELMLGVTHTSFTENAVVAKALGLTKEEVSELENGFMDLGWCGQGEFWDLGNKVAQESGL